jgi:hypothetical protein
MYYNEIINLIEFKKKISKFINGIFTTSREISSIELEIMINF